MEKSTKPQGLGSWIAPWRFILFLALLIIAVPIGHLWLPLGHALMGGFDIAAFTFLVTEISLLRAGSAREMREIARNNDAHRALLLVISGIVSVAILVAVAVELSAGQAPTPAIVILVIGTLALAWLFSNLVYALHYAHLFYVGGEDGKDRGGIAFPGTKEPDYWDFVYFSFTLGMTFQTSDVDIPGPHMRRVVIFHCLAAFVFNIGVLAFTINVLGGKS
ncbi:MAG: DUF1345 domain-containing protein [Sphingomonas sanxanigenens]|uniref:DUF1345 domain-containing protein n=1 Tax=Sphingomonas sanxanigenens TaxID=397260 RepID=A0A2W5A3T1_9SPHN|nr:MAG: DUF1345 domain-containing protein [Sphingomonas sanxanigenens]